MRELIYVPVVHDLWTEGRDKNIIYLLDHPTNNQEKAVMKKELNNYWDSVDNFIETKSINRVYQDSYCSFKNKNNLILDEILKFKNISRNISALNRLIEKGSIIEPTELVLLLDLYLTNATSSKPEKRIKEERHPKIISIRDNYIAMRINNSLRENETGVLFMGLSHNVDEILKNKYNDILVTRYDNIDPLIEITNAYERCFDNYDKLL